MRKHMSEFPQISLHKFLFRLINAEIRILFRLYTNKNQKCYVFGLSKQLVESNQTKLICYILAFCIPWHYNHFYSMRFCTPWHSFCPLHALSLNKIIRPIHLSCAFSILWPSKNETKITILKWPLFYMHN